MGGMEGKGRRGIELDFNEGRSGREEEIRGRAANIGKHETNG